MSPPDVALIAPYPTGGRRHDGPSGVASYTANLAHALADDGLSVAVVAPVEADAPNEPIRSTDGTVAVHRAFRRGPRALRTAAGAALETRAPVVHLQHEVFLYGGPAAAAGLVPGLVALRRRVQSVVTLHQVVDPRTVDRDFTEMHRVKVPPTVARVALGAVQRSAATLASACVVHEQEFAALVPGSEVISHGVEVQPARSDSERAEARGAARRRLGLDDRVVALCFGFLAPYKGIEVVLEAARRTPADEVQIVIAGGAHPRLVAAGDDYDADLRRRYADAGARFTGWVPETDVTDWFLAADVAVFAYPAPFSSSGALALALAHRTPILVSPPLAECTGAPAELVVATDPESLATRLASLSDPVERLRLAAATERLTAERTWPRVAAAHASLYERLVA
jgi:glycosyltransferase involved in cell wall biosynthesis